jgi:hypothetical protein
MRYDDARARLELGYASRPAVEALADAARFFLDAGRVDEKHASLITLR